MISSEPLIKHNIIEKNYKHGIYIWSYSSFGGENIRCDGEIYNNLIQSNLEYGIRCKGKQCRPMIFGGNKVTFNKMAGICATHKARPKIMKNTIEKNLQ